MAVEWLGEIFSVGANAASGGIFGVIGSILGRAGKFIEEKQRQKWEEKKWAHESHLHALNERAAQRKADNEIDAINTAGSWNGLNASYEFADDDGDTAIWVNNCKAMFRPTITLLLWCLAAWVFYTITNETVKGLIQADVDDLVIYMVHSVFFTANTATMWWFGDRALAPPGKKNA